MILFRDWTITSDGLLARQYDNLSRRVEVVGELPEGWTWELLVQVGDAMDIISLTPMEGGVGHTLTAEQVSIDGYYTVQLRGRRGEEVKHTNTTQAFVSKSLSGTAQWPSIPSEFTELEQRMWELNNHPPKPGEDGYWLLWDADRDEYVTSDIPLPEGAGGGTQGPPGPPGPEGPQGEQGPPGPAGSDATVTADSIKSALGYTPADEKVVSQLSDEIANLVGNADTKDETKSGEIVTVTPAKNTTAKVVSKITGQDAGWLHANELRLRHFSGKNLFDFASLFGGVGAVVEKGGLRATINSNGTATIDGKNTSGDWVNILNGYVSDDTNLSYRWIFPAGTYTTPDNLTLVLVRPDSTWSGLGHFRGTFTISEPFWIGQAYIAYDAGSIVNETLPLCMVSDTALPSTGYAFNGQVYTAQFSKPVTDGEFNWQTGELKDADGNLIETITGFEEFPVLDGANTFMTGVGVSTVTYKVPADGSGGNGAVEAFDPEAWGMPVLYLDGNITGMNKDNAVTLNYIYGAKEGTCTLKWQGSSSLSYMKKNYTIKFDKAFEAKEGWGEEKKYCLKANYIDHSHSRNLVNAMLWGQVVKSRNTVPDVFANLINAGAVDGFPILIVMNGEFLGLYTFNIPKDAWMMGMGDGTQECILCAGNACPANGFKEPATLEGDNDLEIEYITNEDDTAWAVTSVNNLISACINSNGTDLDTTIAPMLDWQSAIDYYIFTVLIDGHDMTLKNYLLVTFDGTKWYFSGYDMDCTYGLTWDGKTWLPANTSPTFASFANQHRVMELIKLYKKDALKARYTELRETVLSESNIAVTFANFAGQIPKPVYMQEAKKWPLIPNTSTNDISQIRDYYRMRVAFADKWIEAL